MAPVNVALTPEADTVPFSVSRAAASTSATPELLVDPPELLLPELLVVPELELPLGVPELVPELPELDSEPPLLEVPLPPGPEVLLEEQAIPTAAAHRRAIGDLFTCFPRICSSGRLLATAK
jgi:hypothetical protein